MNNRQKYREIIENNKGRIIIFGAGFFGQNVMKYYGGDYIYAFCDNDKRKHGLVFGDIRVVTKEECISLGYLTLVAIRNRNVANSIINELKSCNISCLDMNIIEDEIYDDMIELAKHRPAHLNIETINFCPMKCVFCINRTIKRPRIVMKQEMFEKVINEYVSKWGGGTLGLCSTQSDFFSDPELKNRIKVLKKHGDKLWVHSTSPLISASKYTDEELADILSVFSFLEISVDGYDAFNYQMMTKVDGFNILIKQLQRISNIIVQNKLKLKLWLAFRTNDYDKCVDSDFFKDISKKFQVSEIKTDYFSWFGNITESDLPLGAKLVKKINLDEKQDCITPWANLSIQSDGRVVGCGCIDWLSHYVIGNINDQTLEEIWLSEKANAFRCSFSTGNVPNICRECALYYPLTIWRDLFLDGYESKKGLYYYVLNGG